MTRWVKFRKTCPKCGVVVTIRKPGIYDLHGPDDDPCPMSKQPVRLPPKEK